MTLPSQLIPATESADADIKVATPEELTNDSPQPIESWFGRRYNS